MSWSNLYFISSALWHTILFIINFFWHFLYILTHLKLYMNMKILQSLGNNGEKSELWEHTWWYSTEISKEISQPLVRYLRRQVDAAWDSCGGSTHQLTGLVSGSRPSASEPLLKDIFKCLAIIFGMHIRLPLVKQQTGNIKSTLPKEKNINRD